MAIMDNGNGSNVQETVKEESVYEDEINLMDYFFVLWKRKWLIFLASVLPALIVGMFFFLWPKNYEITYVYDVSNWNLDERNYNILISRFYSEENTNKIISELQKNNLKQYAKRLSSAGNTSDGLKDYLKFEPIPAYMDIAEAKITDAEQLQKLRQLKAQLLQMTIIGRPKNDIWGISSVIRSNLEKVVSVYMVREQLLAGIRSYKIELAGIERERFNLALGSKTNNSALKKLKSITSTTQNEVKNNVQLQFDIGDKGQYLPLENQIQALELIIVNLEKAVETNEENYGYYIKLLSLNEKLLAEIEKNISSYYTIQQYHSFLTGLIEGYESDELKDYLKSYIKNIENQITANIPVSERPTINPIAKGTVKKSLLVFAMALMLSIFMSFLLESFKNSRA